MSASAGLLSLALFLNADSGLARLLSGELIVFVGKISYGIYLFHEIIWSAYARIFHLSNEAIGTMPQELTALAAVTILSVTAAALHYSIVERRFFNLRDRLEKTLFPRSAR